jgi:hypothetical protein
MPPPPGSQAPGGGGAWDCTRHSGLKDEYKHPTVALEMFHVKHWREPRSSKNVSRETFLLLSLFWEFALERGELTIVEQVFRRDWGRI